MSPNNPEFPVYIISKGRWESRLTSKFLERMNVPYRIVIEEQERDRYAAVIDPGKILILDPAYQRDYDACTTLEPGQSRGSGPARNFVWDHATATGAQRHWIMDDNINGFFRFNHNLKVPVADGAIFRAMEDFTRRYTNVVISGPNYFMFVSRKAKSVPPFVLNTRLFSCLLIRNDIPFRWRARYNEDADLCIRVLKAGYCTVQFNAFLQYKMPTLQMRGGNTDEIYKGGTTEKSKMLVRLHPDMVRLAWRFGRAHHFADYSVFKGNKLIRNADAPPIAGEPNNYGMVLKPKAGGHAVT